MRALRGRVRRASFWLLLAAWTALWVFIIRGTGVLVGAPVGGPVFWVVAVIILVSSWPVFRAYRWAHR